MSSSGLSLLWRNLCHAQVNVHRSVICKNVLSDVHWRADGPIFPGVTDVTMFQCHPTFIWTWLHPRTFPDAKRIILLSKPSMPDVLYRFPVTTTTIFLGEEARTAMDRWSSDGGRCPRLVNLDASDASVLKQQLQQPHLFIE